MSIPSLRRVAAAAGLASATAAAGAQHIAPEVTVPLGDAGVTGYGTAYGTAYHSPTHAPGTVVYDAHGGQFPVYQGYGGFEPPARNPVERIPVQYLRYYPAVWYGLPGSTLPVVAPQVHMPTDTTQLGYYYQRVPTWAPVPGMVPPPPVPEHYHSYRYGYGGYGYGTDVGGTVVAGSESDVQVISSRPLNSTSSSGDGAQTSIGSTPSAPSTIPVPPAPSGGVLPLQPPPAPAAE